MKMLKTVAVLGLAALASPAGAQTVTGYKAGEFLAHVRVIGVLPENFSSSVSGIGGHVHATDQAAPELDLSYFITDHLSVEGIAATTRHSISAQGTSAGKVDVGSVWVLPPTLTLQYHFDPLGGFRPYVGAGVTVAFYYDSHVAGGITRANYSTSVGPALDAGFDYPLGGNWVANFDVKQMFISTKAHIDYGAITAKTNLSPTVVGVGVGYLF